MRFIYVMNKEERDKTISLGFKLIKEDNDKDIWVFENKDIMSFASEDMLTNAGVRYILSDVLTF